MSDILPVKKFSPSSLGCHSFCPMKYFIQNSLGIREPSNPKTEMGSIVHAILETVAKSKLGNQLGEKLTKENVYGSYTTDYEKLNITELIDNVYTRYTSKRPYIAWPDNCYEQIVEWSYKVIDTPNDPRNFEIIGIEDRFALGLDYDWAKYAFIDKDGNLESGSLKITGIIDLIYKVNDRLHVVDYKTGQRVDWNSQESKPPKKDMEALQKDLQLIIYYMNSVDKFNTDNISVEINYINDGGLFALEYNETDINYALEHIKKVFSQVKSELPRQHITWKCKAFCHYGRKTFSDIKRPELAMLSDGRQHITKKGQEYKICEAVNKFLQERPIDLVIERCKYNG